MTRYAVFALVLVVLTSCSVAPAATVVPSPTPMPVPTAAPTLPPTPTVDAQETIRAEQAVRNIVIPNTAKITAAVNNDMMSIIQYYRAAQCYGLKYELGDWKTERIESGQYRVHVTVAVLEECECLQKVCDEDKELVDVITANPVIKGCEVPAEFLVLLENPVTVVPKNTCAETLYY